MLHVAEVFVFYESCCAAAFHHYIKSKMMYTDLFYNE